MTAPDTAPEVSTLTDDRLESEVVGWSAHVSAAMAHWLGLVAEYDRRELWARWQCTSMVNWLAWQCGIDQVTAREHVRVARRLIELPLIRAAFEQGRLSYSKVRALTRMATAATEADLTEVAMSLTASQLARLRRGYELAAGRLTPAAQDERRGLHMTRRSDGTWVGHFRLAADAGAAVKAALESFAEQRSAQGMADAMVSLLTIGGEPGEGATLMVHLEAAELTTNAVVDPGVANIGDTRITAEVARRIGCDSHVIASIDDAAGNPLRLGRRRRVVSRALRRALVRRDRHCRFPGCERHGKLFAHHLVHWAHGGETSLENLVLVCAEHHRALHEHGWKLVATESGAGFEAVAPEGEMKRMIMEGNIDAARDLSVDMAPPAWFGPRLGLANTVEALLWREATARAAARAVPTAA